MFTISRFSVHTYGLIEYLRYTNALFKTHVRIDRTLTTHFSEHTNGPQTLQYTNALYKTHTYPKQNPYNALFNAHTYEPQTKSLQYTDALFKTHTYGLTEPLQRTFQNTRTDL